MQPSLLSAQTPIHSTHLGLETPYCSCRLNAGQWDLQFREFMGSLGKPVDDGAETPMHRAAAGIGKGPCFLGRASRPLQGWR